MTPAGKLNKLIYFQYRSKVPDGMGGFTETWINISNDPVWAAIWSTKASEIVSAESTRMNITHRIRIRYRLGIRPDWRIKFGNRYFQIIQGPLDPEEKNEHLDMYCKEVI